MPEDATLLKSQRNNVFQSILQFSLNPIDFTWLTREDPRARLATISRLEHVSGYYFQFSKTASYWSPDIERRHGERLDSAGFSWDERLTQVREWLGYLKREVTSPDLWASLQEAQALQTAATSNNIENAPFTAAELITVELKLNELKEYIVGAAQLSNAQIKHLEDQMRYLAEASSLLGRKDWYNILISVLFSIVVAGVFAPDRAQELFQVVAGMFEPLLRSVMQLLT